MFTWYEKYGTIIIAISTYSLNGTMDYVLHKKAVKSLNMKEKLAVIIGPTAVGKTKLSIQLAKRFNGEIISGDSMQIYRGMDIGTAKIKEHEMDGVPHHLIDIRNPDETFSVKEFQELVRNKIKEIAKNNHLPIIVGGTGLYIQSVLYDYQFSDVSENKELRERLFRKAEEEGREALYSELQSIDPKSAQNIHPNNVRRVVRALEIFYTTGKTMSEYVDNQNEELLYDVALVGLTMDRELLYKRINKRVDLMLEEGLIEETKRLYEKGLRNDQSVQAIGYKELFEYFEGRLTLEMAIDLIKKNSRHYAKRQLTWFRNKMNVQWFDMTDFSNEEKIFEKISQYVAGKLDLKSNT